MKKKDIGTMKKNSAKRMDAALFEKIALTPPKLSTALRELHPLAGDSFKYAYEPITHHS